MTGTQGPAMVTAVPRTATSMRLGRPITTLCSTTSSAPSPRVASSAPSAPAALPVAGSSGTPMVGPNMRAHTEPGPDVQQQRRAAERHRGFGGGEGGRVGAGSGERGEIGELDEHLREADGGDTRWMCGAGEGSGRNFDPLELHRPGR